MTKRIPPFPLAQAPRPVLGHAPPASRSIPRPKAPTVANRRWCFSFRFFKQERYFAFEGLNSSWFASLFDRLQSMCGLFLDEMKNPTLSGDLRCHPVRWGDYSNFTRAYFDWIPSPYFEAEEEYPLLQFMVSQSLGRVVGFFDEEEVFQVVAFDPKHNIQKSSGRTGRKDCQPIRSDLMDLQTRVDRALAALDSNAPDAASKARFHLVQAATGVASQERVWVTIDLHEADANELHKHIVAQPGRSLRDVVERGLLAFLDDAQDALKQVAESTEDAGGDSSQQ